MKNTIILYSAIAICFALISGCNKDNSGTNPVNNNIPLVTLVGTPTGPAVTASIDASGGTLSSADGMLLLTVPAGAVSSTTIFSIQPVSNQCPGGFGMAYRLLPEGITFAQPVSLSFSYADNLLSNEALLKIAYQGADKTWFAPKVASLNATQNKISVETKHFCTFAVFLKIFIKPMDTTLKIKESMDLEVIYVGNYVKNNAPGMEELDNLVIIKTIVSTWEVNGTGGNATSGTIAKLGDTKARFTAPSKVPSQNPVAISAMLSDQKDYTQKVIANIRVIGNEVLFSVAFTSSRPYQPVGKNWFTETDGGSMSVSVQDDSVKVYDIKNVSASVTPNFLYDAGTNCTYTLVSPGDGPFHVSPGVSFGGGYSSYDHMIYIGINSLTYPMGYTPSFQKSCNGGSPVMMGGEKLPTGPYGFSFDTNKDYQEFITKIPGGGVWPDGFLKTAVTKVK